jgi:hypothetical protein
MRSVDSPEIAGTENIAMTNSKTLLTYALSTAPSPLQVSASITQPSVATLTIGVSCPSEIGSADVSQIVIALPVRSGDPDATELALTAPPGGDVAISASNGERWHSAEDGSGVYVFTPQAGRSTLSSQSLTISFNAVEISTLVGTAIIHIREWASATGEPPSLTDLPSGTGMIAAAKFPLGFFFTDFTADGPQVKYGGTVTLTWNGSTDAEYVLRYLDQRVPVSNQRSWTSPALYDPVVAFTLRASATQNRETVSLDLNTTVVVASPTVLSFAAQPDQVNLGDAMTLTWRTTHADGADLITGETGRERLPPVSDETRPKKITPKPGVSYTLSAYKAGPDGETHSPPVPLEFNFLPLQIKTFAADPPIVSQGTPTTKLSWQVINTLGVTLDERKVDQSGSQPESPLRDMTYRLAATAIDGTVTTQDLLVKSRKITAASFIVSGPHRFGVKDVTISIAAAVQSLDLSQLIVRYADNTEAEPPVTDLTQTSPGQWAISVTGFPSTAPVEKSTFILDLTLDGETITGLSIPPSGYAPHEFSRQETHS